MTTPIVSVSVVSHLQANMVKSLLFDIELHCRSVPLELILTLNLPEALPFDASSFSFPVRLLKNGAALGFSANHNQAFNLSSGQYFCVLNPDIRLHNDPFPVLLSGLRDPGVGVVAPLVLGPDGTLEDSVRHFPSPLKIVCKLLGRCKGSDYVVGDAPVRPDWAAGMFLMFPRAIFEKLNGFDQRYFLYYEDVDICARLKLLGKDVLVCPHAKVVHRAHRGSHRQLRYLRWHLASMLHFFLSSVYLRLLWRKCLQWHPTHQHSPK